MKLSMHLFLCLSKQHEEEKPVVNEANVVKEMSDSSR